MLPTNASTLTVYLFVCFQAVKAARLTPEQAAAQRQEEARRQEEELRKLLQKLPRPTMASRTDTSVSLNLSRGNRDEQVANLHHLSLPFADICPAVVCTCTLLLPRYVQLQNCDCI